MSAAQALSATSAPIIAEEIRIRTLEEGDTDAVVALLLEGFDDRTEDYWRHAMLRLRDRELPSGYPRYGYGLSASGKLVGVLLLIFAQTDDGTIRANVSSWYVQPDYRFYSAMLISKALRLKDVTLVNVSPAPHTIPTISAQGFSCYAGGTMAAIPALGPVRWGARLSVIAPRTGPDASVAETQAALGCLAFMVSYRGRDYPFAFVRRTRHRHGVPMVQLAYCESVDSYVMFSGLLGRHLLRHGFLAVIHDANDYQRGLLGCFFRNRKVKYYRGPVKPRLGDLSNTELVLFGP